MSWKPCEAYTCDAGWECSRPGHDTLRVWYIKEHGYWPYVGCVQAYYDFLPTLEEAQLRAEAVAALEETS